MKCEHTEEDEKESQTEGLEVDNEIQSETDFEETATTGRLCPTTGWC